MDTKDAHYQLLLADDYAGEAIRAGRSVIDAQIDLMTADHLREEARRALQHERNPLHGVGGELVSHDAASNDLSRKTLLRGKVATKASVERLNLVQNVDAFDLAVDAAESIGAANALEKMVAHGVAVAHKTALHLLEQNKTKSDPLDEVRRINAAARLMTIVQTGALTIQRLRTGGRQVMTVRHVTVEAGGQAVIGSIGGSSCDTTQQEENNG